MFPCSPSSRQCIPQPSTSTKIDILSYRQRPTWRAAYRNFGTHESIVTNQSVEATAGTAGVRWYELRSPNSAPFIHQQGTYAPADGIHRWMGSAAMDGSGNLAVGYSAGNSSVYPSLYYTGRLAGDPLGTLPQGEAVLHTGTGSQTGSARWGDYTSLNIDSTDDCTFWYVNEYVPTTSSAGWKTRIGSFRFPVGPPPGTLTATPATIALPYNHLYRYVNIKQTKPARTHCCLTAPTWSLLSATSNEPDSGCTLGDLPNDIVQNASNPFRFTVRAEKCGASRTYTFTYRLTDCQSSYADYSVTVKVP